MPNYVYFCPECEQKIEKFHGMTEQIDKTCPNCQKPDILFRIPSNIYIGEIKNTGKLVKEFIDATREDTQKEKERLLRQEYKK